MISYQYYFLNSIFFFRENRSNYYSDGPNIDWCWLTLNPLLQINFFRFIKFFKKLNQQQGFEISGLVLETSYAREQFSGTRKFAVYFSGEKPHMIHFLLILKLFLTQISAVQKLQLYFLLFK